MSSSGFPYLETCAFKDEARENYSPSTRSKGVMTFSALSVATCIRKVFFMSGRQNAQNVCFLSFLLANSLPRK